MTHPTQQPQRDIIFVAMGAPGGIGRAEQQTIAALHLLAGQNQVRVHLLQLAPRPAASASHELYIFSAQGNRWRLAVALLLTIWRHPRAFILFGHVNLAPLTLFRFLLRTRPRYAVFAYGIDVWSPLHGLRRWVLCRASVVLSISNYTTEQLVAVQDVEASRVRLVSLAYRLEGEKTTGLRTVEDEQASASPQLLSVTRLDASEQMKGVDLVIQAMPQLVRTYPALRYEIIGQGSDMPRLKRLATELRVSQHINFRGFVSDSELRAAYAACDVFVLPSAKEGFGLVYLEAMAECKPVVAANAGGVPDVVVDGETGVLIPPGDVGALTEALLTLLDNPEMQRQLGAAGAARVQTHFSFEQFVQRLGRALALPSGGGSC